MTTLEIKDKTGLRTVIDPDPISGELWIDGEYCGQFIIHSGTMFLIHGSGIIETYISTWSWVGMRLGHG